MHLWSVAPPTAGLLWDGVRTASSGKGVERGEDTHLARAEHHPGTKDAGTCAKVVDVDQNCSISIPRELSVNNQNIPDSHIRDMLISKCHPRGTQTDRGALPSINALLSPQ